jgi:hypothetical protein
MEKAGTQDAAKQLMGSSGKKLAVSAATLAKGLKHDFSRSGIKVDINSKAIDEMVKRSAGANVKILDQFSSGDRLCARYSCTVKGEDVPGAKPGSTATVTGLVVGRVADGKVVEVWHEQDTVGMLLALGVPVGV